MTKDNIESIGLGQKLSQEHLSGGKKRLGRTIFFVFIGLVLVGLIGGWLFFGNTAPKYEFVKVTTKDIRESVEITGNVEAGATINLSFRDSGQVDKINSDVGVKLKKDDVIATLKNRDQQLRLDQAKANLAGAAANLNQKIAGSTNEDVLIAEAGVTKADAAASKINIDFLNARDALELMRLKYAQDEKKAQLMVDDAKSKWDFSLKNQTNTGKTQNQSVETAKQDLEAQLYLTASQIQQSLINLKSIIVDDGNSVLALDYSRLDNYSINTSKQLYYDTKYAFDPLYLDLKVGTGYASSKLKDFAVKEQELVGKLLQSQKVATDMLSILPVSTTLTNDQLTVLKSKLLADSSSLSSSLSGLNMKYQSILTALLNVTTGSDSSVSTSNSAENYYDQQLQNLVQNKIDHQVDLSNRQADIRSLQAQYQIQLADVDSAKANLQSKKVGPRAVDLAFLRAQVGADKIAVSLAQEALEKTLLRAPFDGILSRKNIEVGEDVAGALSTSGKSVFEMISADKLKINANIAEVDISKIKIGDKAEIILDAVGSDKKFAGTITKIDPVETKIQDVVFYKAEVVIDSQDTQIKPGMTATVNIVLKQALGALSIPDKAVQTDGTKQYVRILEVDKVKNIDVVTGVRNLQGDLEIKFGLVKDQEIILRTLNARN